MKFISIGTEEIDDIAFQQESDIIDVKEDILENIDEFIEKEEQKNGARKIT